MTYFFYAFGIAHLVVAITTLFHSGHDPFFVALSFILLFGGACFLGAGHMFYKIKLMMEYPSHAVEDNTPEYDMETLNIPAYLRRTEAKQLELPF